MRKLIMRCTLAIGATVGWQGAPGYAAAVFAGPQSDPVFGVVAPELTTAMFPNQRLELTAVSGSEAGLDRVIADPASLAVTDLATMLDYGRRNALAADRLQFQSVAGRRCLLGFTQRGGWLRSFADLAAAGAGPPPVIGVADAEAAAMLAILRRFEPGLGATVPVVAPLAEIIARAAKGTIDLALVMVNPEFDPAQIERLADDPRLTRIAVVSRMLGRAGAERESGFVLVPMRTDSGLLPWSRAPDVTLCAPIGAVTRDDAPALLRETIGRAAPVVAGILRTSLSDRTMKVAQSALDDIMGMVKDLLGRF